MTKYQPVPSHQDPIHLRNYKNVNLVRPRSLIFPNAISVFVPLAGTLSGLDPSKKMRIERRHLQKRGYRGSISHQRFNYVGFCFDMVSLSLSLPWAFSRRASAVPPRRSRGSNFWRSQELGQHRENPSEQALFGEFGPPKPPAGM